NTVPHTVHLIIETLASARGTHQSFVKVGRELDKHVAPNQGQVVVVDPGFTAELTTKAMKLVADESVRNVHTVKTLGEARTYLTRYMTEHPTT
ncbi:MAG TPA: hypothetical protein VHL11_10820, partial [Phototrophicaceae bacterium]|nr:hypothetical protein [Phototrophicaceae bacterium]